MAKQTTSKLYKERGIGKEGATVFLEWTDMINRLFLNKLTVQTATRSFLKMTIVARRYSKNSTSNQHFAGWKDLLQCVSKYSVGASWNVQEEIRN